MIDIPDDIIISGYDTNSNENPESPLIGGSMSDISKKAELYRLRSCTPLNTKKASLENTETVNSERRSQNSPTNSEIERYQKQIKEKKQEAARHIYSKSVMSIVDEGSSEYT